MKKNLLLSSALLLAASTMTAAPEGNMYLMGLNGQTTQDETNLFVLGERSEDDIEEGVWRWSLQNVEVTEGVGTLTVAGTDGFTLGYNPDNLMGMANLLNNTYKNAYLTPGGEALNYDLAAGPYNVTLALFEDSEGDMGGDSWMLGFQPLNAEEESESYYLIGFNGMDTPSAAFRFVKEEIEDEGEISYAYSIPRIYLGECPAGFTVFDSSSDTTYGKGELTAAVTEDSPMAFLSPGETPVECTLPAGYYTVNFAAMGSMAMATFLKCEDQTPDNELTYYLKGLNGTTALSDECKFTREVENGSYTDEESGEVIDYTNIMYTLTAEVKESCELTVVSADEALVFGYNSDMALVFPNDFNSGMPMAVLVINGAPVNCNLNPGKYTFNFVITENGSALLSALDAEEGAVEGVEVDSDATPVYYNLQGQRVMNPAKGIFIEKRGSKTSKVIF